MHILHILTSYALRSFHYHLNIVSYSDITKWCYPDSIINQHSDFLDIHLHWQTVRNSYRQELYITHLITPLRTSLIRSRRGETFLDSIFLTFTGENRKMILKPGTNFDSNTWARSLRGQELRELKRKCPISSFGACFALPACRSARQAFFHWWAFLRVPRPLTPSNTGIITVVIPYFISIAFPGRIL